MAQVYRNFNLNGDLEQRSDQIKTLLLANGWTSGSQTLSFYIGGYLNDNLTFTSLKDLNGGIIFYSPYFNTISSNTNIVSQVWGLSNSTDINNFITDIKIFLRNSIEFPNNNYYTENLVYDIFIGDNYLIVLKLANTSWGIGGATTHHNILNEPKIMVYINSDPISLFTNYLGINEFNTNYLAKKTIIRKGTKLYFSGDYTQNPLVSHDNFIANDDMRLLNIRDSNFVYNTSTIDNSRSKVGEIRFQVDNQFYKVNGIYVFDTSDPLEAKVNLTINGTNYEAYLYKFNQINYGNYFKQIVIIPSLIGISQVI
ncbi:MAG: hypothetical protein ACP5O4_06005 [bacterium]